MAKFLLTGMFYTKKIMIFEQYLTLSRKRYKIGPNTVKRQLQLVRHLLSGAISSDLE